MGYYYNYFAGYKLDGKFYPLGPYDNKGKIHPIISRSASFASKLYRDFYVINDVEISDELRKEFEYSNWKEEKVCEVKYLPLLELPGGSFIQTGYFLINDVKQYELDQDYDFDGFYDRLTPEVYAAKLQHEITFGKNQPQKDEEDEEYTEPNASDYMYYAYPDYHSEEYEADIIRQVIHMLDEYGLPEKAELVVLETEG